MKIELLLTGKTDSGYLPEGIKLYENRLKHYCTYSRKEIPELKKASALTESQIKDKEGELILKNISDSDWLVLLDAKGEGMTSEEFSSKIQGFMLKGVKRVVFAVGGAYGFSNQVYDRSNQMISLSPMTFSHQMVRLVFVEQLYRAFTIIKGEPYHHK